jgi:hypothetical protein
MIVNHLHPNFQGSYFLTVSVYDSVNWFRYFLSPCVLCALPLSLDTLYTLYSLSTLYITY